MSRKRIIALLLGGGLWLAGLSTVASSVYTVRARVSRPTRLLRVRVPSSVGLTKGDSVFYTTAAGLKRVGEVVEEVSNDRENSDRRINRDATVRERANRDAAGGARKDSRTSGNRDATVRERAIRTATVRERAIRTATAEERTYTLAIEPLAFDRLNASTRATCWRTPLSAEAAITALLPVVVQRKVSHAISADWRNHQEELADAWRPVARELASSYLAVVNDDIQAAFRRHDDELWTIARSHAREFAARWPAIQEHLGPILQEQLTPVLSRLMNEAIAEAPKMSIAWNVARGNNTVAFQRMLDFLADFLAQMSDGDRAELSEAVKLAWEASRNDPVLVRQFSEIGREMLDDKRLWNLLTEIYNEAIANNPRTAEFLRREVLESPRIREHIYRFIETFGPTARGVLSLCLFDEEGVTRPEVVHIVRSAALGRNIAWITLETIDADAPPLGPGATLVAAPPRGRRYGKDHLRPPTGADPEGSER